MHRPRHRPRRSARLSFSLFAVLSALFLVALPALAQADSVEKQYEVEVPSAGIPQKAPKKQSEKTGEPQAEASEAPEGGGKQPKPSAEGNSEEPEESKGTAPPARGNGGNPPTDKGGSPGGNGSKQTSTGIGDEQSLGSGTTQGQNASHSDGGSSPLVPILIAIAVLAAISIGAVIYRQRRQGSGGTGSPVSPNA